MYFCPFQAFTGTSGLRPPISFPDASEIPQGLCQLPVPSETVRTLVSLSSFSWGQVAENWGRLIAES